MYATQQQPYRSNTSFAEKPTYEEIMQRKAEQDRLVAAGLMEQPKIKYGFSIGDRICMQGATPTNELWQEFTQKYENLDTLFAEIEFKQDVERAITGDELQERLNKRIYKMFENESVISSGSRAVSV